MKNKYIVSLLIPLFFIACGEGFERFVPPSNSISGRGAKVPPHVLTTTPVDGATVSPITSSSGTQIKVVFDMTMKPTSTSFINTYVRDVGQSNENIWYAVANSGATFTWSSTNVGNDTVTIQLGWVRWPENNVIGFDFNNSLLTNLDDIALENSTRFSFTVGFDPGRYKVVQTSQEACYLYSPTLSRWEEKLGCTAGGGSDPLIGAYDYPAGQNGFFEPKNSTYGITFYGTGAGGAVNGRRFIRNANPQNIALGTASNCTGNASDVCEPYTVDPVTTLVWKTCSQGQYYADTFVVGAGDKCVTAGTDFTWGDAVNACSGMNTMNSGQGYGGRTDWRLPTAQELEGLVDYGIRNYTPLTQGEPAPGYPEGAAIDGYLETTWPFNPQGAFPNTPITKGFWTATGISARFNGAITYANALVVEFAKGTIGSGNNGSLLDSRKITTNRKKVRCVAGPAVAAPTPSFTPSALQVGTQSLTTSGGNFMGYDAATRFNVASAVASRELTTTTDYYVSVTFDSAPNVAQSTTLANYCIALASATNCATPALTFPGTIALSGNTVKIQTTAHVAGTAYKIYVTGVTSLGAVALTNGHARFTAYPASTFDVASAVSPATSQVQVTFNKLPTASEATNAANYCVSTVTASPIGSVISAAAAAGANSFAITSGIQAGKTLVVHGNATTSTSLYDPSVNTFAGGPALSGTSGAGSHSISIGTGVQAGKTLVIRGGGVNGTSLYDPATNTFLGGANLSAVANTGANAFAITTGGQAGKTLVVHGNAATGTSLYDPNLDTFGGGPALSAVAGAGSSSFAITSGPQSGKTLVVHGNGGTTTSLYDPVANTFGGGPALAAAAGAGSNNISITYGPQGGKVLVIHANGTNTTSLYDPTTNTFSAGPVLSAVAGTGSQSIAMPAGFLIFHANGALTTSFYNPVTNTIVAGSTLTAVAGNGLHSFIVSSGLQNGKTILVHGNTGTATSIFDSCAISVPAVSSASLSGYTVSLTTSSALTAATGYEVFIKPPTAVTYLGAQVVTDNNNKLLWKRCRYGVFDNSTCGDDGVASNDSLWWNDGMNYCNELNAQNYGGYVSGGLTDQYRWRAPTINELKSIADRTLFPQVGYSIDTAIFPTPNVMTENYASSTHRTFNGDAGGAAPSPPANDLVWALDYIVGFPSYAAVDRVGLMPVGLKPPKKQFRCVRSLP